MRCSATCLVLVYVFSPDQSGEPQGRMYLQRAPRPFLHLAHRLAHFLAELVALEKEGGALAGPLLHARLQALLDEDEARQHAH